MKKKLLKKTSERLRKALCLSRGGVIEDHVVVFGPETSPGDEARIIGVIDVEPG